MDQADQEFIGEQEPVEEQVGEVVEPIQVATIADLNDIKRSVDFMATNFVSFMAVSSK